jgi:ATP synthase protein I
MPSDGSTPDPRLEIPEVLRTPVRQPAIDPVTGESLSPSGEKAAPTIDTTAMGKAWAMGLDFVFTILAGVALGWLADYLLGSAPIGILVGIGMGFASGLLRMIRAANRQQQAFKRRP